MFGHPSERGINSTVAGAPRRTKPHLRCGGDTAMTQNACVVIQQLNKDMPPETAQPLAILKHGNGTVGSLIRRLERLHLHVCNGSDQNAAAGLGEEDPLTSR
jgi:hypothetical protein